MHDDPLGFARCTEHTFNMLRERYGARTLQHAEGHRVALVGEVEVGRTDGARFWWKENWPSQDDEISFAEE